MPNLSAYLNFSVSLRYDLTTKVIRLTDTSTYPAGVNTGITGIITVTHPDGITRTGSFSSPDITYTNSALTVGVVELRQATNGQPQAGAYTISYTVRHASYDDTTLTRVFTVSLTDPSLDITKAFNVFTPNIRAIDTTVYDVTGYAIQSVLRSWTAQVGNVGSTTGAAQEFSIGIGGVFYDADYTITLTSTVEWNSLDYSYLKIYRKISETITGSADRPKTLAVLRSDLDAYKLELDALLNNSEQYDTKNFFYTRASLLYQQLLEKGRNGEYTGLEDYYYEIVRCLNDGIVPSYTNTNTAISAYDWGVISGTTWATLSGKPSDSVRVQWITGQVGYPAAGTSTYTNSAFTNLKVLYFRNGILQYKGNPGNGDSYYEKPDTGAGSNVLTVYNAFQTGEVHVIITLPI